MIPRLGPILTRIGGLPSTAADVVVPDVRTTVDDVLTIEDELTQATTAAVDVLYRLVPQLDDDVALRRAVLAGKRAINRRQLPSWPDTTRERLTDRLTAEDAATLDAWERHVTRRATLVEQLDVQLADHHTEVGRALAATLNDPAFRTSLALAAPSFLRYGRFDEPKALSARSLQTLYSYVTRAALKTSPFSGLTTVGSAGTRGRGAVRSQTSVTVGYLALLRLARDPATAGLLRYRTAPVRPGGPDEPNGVLLHAELMIADGTIWRQDRVVEADHAISWLNRLSTAGGDRMTLDEILAAIGGAIPFRRYLRLLDSGLLQPVPPWQLGATPLPALAALVTDGSNAEQHVDLHADLRRAYECGEQVALQDTAARLRAATEVSRLASLWMTEDDAGNLPSGLIYEDRETDLDLTDPTGTPTVRADLTSYAALVRPGIFRSHVYDFLVDRFVAEFGAGGRCTDPLGFLMRLTVERDSNPGLDLAARADHRSRANPEPRSQLPVGPTSAPPTAGILFQLDALDEDAVRAGRHRLVVNHFSAGTGGLFSRFVSLLGPEFATRLREYAGRCWPGVPVRQLNLWTECNTVQSECAGLLPPLLLPGEVGGPDALRLADTELRHDPHTGTLSLTTSDGVALGLGYLSLIPQHLLQSYVRLLAVLADPWINASPHTDYTMTRLDELAAHCGDDVRHLERVEHGRIVVRRRSWIVPVDALPLADLAGNDTQRLLAMASFRQRHGLPSEVFVHQLGSVGFAMSGVRKPLWVALDSPTALTVFRNWLHPDTRHLRVVEALPGRDGRYATDRDGRPRVTEHALLMAWPRPGGHDDHT
ncbi:hypothetical protein [Cryptosporangium minutisporangium]|uniref:Lantibiotic dehydratase n=1 Tax=Cryptosporangium minutisporangium TaxID=113569 RepID=A0ABP6T061_9ACTN